MNRHEAPQHIMSSLLQCTICMLLYALVTTSWVSHHNWVKLKACEVDFATAAAARSTTHHRASAAACAVLSIRPHGTLTNSRPFQHKSSMQVREA
jgi:hypothetical protein